MKSEIKELVEIVQTSFQNANKRPDISRWLSCSIVAGCAAARMAIEGEFFMAASMEGVAEEARRQALALQPRVAA